MCQCTMAESCKGEYWNRKFRKRVLPQLRAETPILMEPHVIKVLRQQGFSFNPTVDNKSVYIPDKLFDCLAKYFDPIDWEPSWNEYDQAWAITTARFAKPEFLPYLEVLSLDEAKGHVKLMKASSAPFFEKKGEALERDLKVAEGILSGKVPPPCVSYHRIQHGEAGPKTRLVWGYPLAMTLIEGRIAAPLITSFLSRRTPMAFGLTKLGISARLQVIINRNYQVGLDFSRFDATIHAKLIQRAFWILRTWFEPSEEIDKLFHQIENYFVFTPIVMPDGNIYVKRRGVPSGSWFTQLVDSIINYFAIQYAMLKIEGHPLGKDNLLVLGDDSVFSSYKDIDIQSISSQLRKVGLSINVQKTAKSKHGMGLQFLGHDWTRGLPDRPLLETAKRMAFPERWSQVEASSRLRANYRFASYLADSLSAYKIYRNLPWNKIPGIMQLAFRAEQGPVLTGWQIFMQSLGQWHKATVPDKLFYLGVCA